jgi:hypothetical protein
LVRGDDHFCVLRMMLGAVRARLPYVITSLYLVIRNNFTVIFMFPCCDAYEVRVNIKGCFIASKVDRVEAVKACGRMEV